MDDPAPIDLLAQSAIASDAQRRAEQARRADLDAQERAYQRAMQERASHGQASAGAHDLIKSPAALAQDAARDRQRLMYGAGDIKINGNVISRHDYTPSGNSAVWWVATNGALSLQAVSQPLPSQ